MVEGIVTAGAAGGAGGEGVGAWDEAGLSVVVARRVALGGGSGGGGGAEEASPRMVPSPFVPLSWAAAFAGDGEIGTPFCGGNVVWGATAVGDV